MENETSRSAKILCAIAVCQAVGESKILKGEFFGEIAYDMKGSGGFGYDCLFYLPEYKKTSAEIPAELKNQISHRAKALRKLKEYLLAAAERKGEHMLRSIQWSLY
jgi:XTP/dITP diphosphohydrolase